MSYTYARTPKKSDITSSLKNEKIFIHKSTYNKLTHVNVLCFLNLFLGHNDKARSHKYLM